ncbi:hypothetical protein J1605_003785 [Eschrichtius robustus]|uniref:Uncharacterized protein n=1 Tax=Eschrichtius robustus TaxID=9764 RepID=A0AB34HPV4_ESCRO|nr:hypothetical protein J1605_003785 [Eschrichtius robustus]
MVFEVGFEPALEERRSCTEKTTQVSEEQFAFDSLTSGPCFHLLETEAACTLAPTALSAFEHDVGMSVPDPQLGPPVQTAVQTRQDLVDEGQCVEAGGPGAVGGLVAVDHGVDPSGQSQPGMQRAGLVSQGGFEPWEEGGASVPSAVHGAWHTGGPVPPEEPAGPWPVLLELHLAPGCSLSVHSQSQGPSFCERPFCLCHVEEAEPGWPAFPDEIAGTFRRVLVATLRPPEGPPHALAADTRAYALVQGALWKMRTVQVGSAVWEKPTDGGGNAKRWAHTGTHILFVAQLPGEICTITNFIYEDVKKPQHREDSSAAQRKMISACQAPGLGCSSGRHARLQRPSAPSRAGVAD